MKIILIKINYLLLGIILLGVLACHTQKKSSDIKILFEFEEDLNIGNAINYIASSSRSRDSHRFNFIKRTIEYIPQSAVFVQQIQPEIMIGSSIGLTKTYQWDRGKGKEFPEYMVLGEVGHPLEVVLLVKRKYIKTWQDILETNTQILVPHLAQTYSGFLVYLTLWAQAQDLYKNDKKLIRRFFRRFLHEHALLSSDVSNTIHMFLQLHIGSAMMIFRSQAELIVSQSPVQFSIVSFPKKVFFPVYLQIRKDFADSKQGKKLVQYLYTTLFNSEDRMDFKKENNFTFLGGWNSIILTHVMPGGEFDQIFSKNDFFFSQSDIIFPR